MVVFELSLIDISCHTLFFSFEVYSVNKQINKRMNRPKYNPQGMNDKKSQPLTGNANNVKTSNHPN